MTTTTRDPLTHQDWCPKRRVETTEHPPSAEHPDGVTTTHCVDCGAHAPDAPAVSGAFADAARPLGHGVGFEHAPDRRTPPRGGAAA